MIKLSIPLFLLASFLHAEITFKDIDSKPAGRAKNFMIWQYLKQDISSKEADAAYSQVTGNIWKIKKEYLKKSTNPLYQKQSKCKSEKELLSIVEQDCLNLALNPYKTLSLDSLSRETLLKRVESKKMREIIKIQAEPYSELAYMSYDSNTLLTMFISTTSQNRQNNLNINYSKNFMNKMFSEEASNWKKFSLIKLIVNLDSLDNLQQSLLFANGLHVDSQSNFLLGLNQLKYSRTSDAIKQFKLAIGKSTKQLQTDKINFWIYLTTGKVEYLKELLLSSKINIYTLYAHEKLSLHVDNYFSSVGTEKEKSDKNICDPFVWNKIMKEIKETPKEKLFELANKYNQRDMMAVQSFIIEKAYRFKMHGFVMPYDEYLQDVSTDKKALVYALMRQESNLIPSALSRSFALGLMQIMPFVTDDLSKKVQSPIACYNDMFEPKYNIQYALKHLQWMEKSLYHPLFIAYAYNGGMGYFRKHLKSGAFSKGKYEPFLSMELMRNKESREYGKKVLSNYVMYKKILGEEVSLISLLENLKDPKKTDRFR